MDFSSISEFSQRDLPYSLEAEQTVLGALLLEPETLSIVMEHLKPESFYNEKHRDLFGIIIRM
ncbi:MAG TPA: DnaB-like helicase N-terminal domain-containing protein, partial [Oscillospiraceae bacterium]|nr:DnaB-like helicase N-terminal domain-containing protein [Oscillospiraceae bacterium]